MTLICRIEHKGEMLLISDGLISSASPAAVSPDIGLASGQSSSKSPGENASFKIVGIHRKIEIINETFLFAWAGSATHARAFIREIKERVGKRSVTLEDVNAVLEVWEHRDRDELSILGQLVQSQPDSPGAFGLDFFEMNYSEVEVGEFRLVGSGSGFSEFVDIFRGVGVDDVVDESAAQTLEVLGLKLLTLLMCSEVFTGESLRSAWGGFYEATIVGRDLKYKHLDDITWLFFVARKSPNSKEYLVSLVTKVTALRYVDDTPAFIDVVFDVSQEQKIRFRRVSMFGATGFDKEAAFKAFQMHDGKRVQDIDFNSKTLCLAMASIDAAFGIGVLVKHDSSAEVPCIIKFTDSMFQFSMRNDLKRELFESFQKNLDGLVATDLGLENFPH